MRIAPSKPQATNHKPAFTLVELLVVVAVIVILIAMLLPAMEQAIYHANQAKCLSNARGQTTAHIFYATDNGARFAPNTYWPNSPDYLKNSAYPNDPASLMRGSYIPNGWLTICPLTSTFFPSFADPFWTDGTYGGLNTDPTYILSSYMWLGGFAPAGATVTMVNGESPPPKMRQESSSRTAFIAHRTNYFYWPDTASNYLYDLGHRGSGWTQPIVVPYDDFGATDATVGYGDGSGAIHSKSSGEIKPRMVIDDGRTTTDPRFPGTYLW